MDLPASLGLPFFSYGLFQPAQIGFGQIRPFVRTVERGWTTSGTLLERDGLPLLDHGSEQVSYEMLLASLTELHGIFQRVLQAELSSRWK